MQMWAKLKRLSRLQRITLVLFVATVVNSIMDYTIGYQVLGGDLLGVLFAIALIALVLTSMRPLARKMVWRVRNRLLVTYLLFGVVPLFLIAVMLAMGSYVLFGQIAASMVRDDIQRRMEITHSAAYDLGLAALSGERAAEVREDVMRRSPGVQAVIRSGSNVSAIPANGVIRDIPAWMQPGYRGMLEQNGAFLIASSASVQLSGRKADVLAYVPVDSKMLADFAPDLGVVSIYGPNFTSSSRNIGIGADVKRRANPNPNPEPQVVSGRALPAGRGWWDRPIEWPSIMSAKGLDGRDENVIMTVKSRPSLFIPRLFRSFGTMARYLGYVLVAIAVVFLLVEAVSLMLSVGLTRSITRVVHDLYAGTRKVANADFSHRIPVRRQDQLGELVGSFNGMTGQIQHLIEEVKEKEKLEAELEIAREVQAQLFPKGVPQLKTLQLAGVCNPARVVSGDYYDFVPIATRWMAIVIGDIAGKGISAALLMASIQSSLHAQLTLRDSVDAPSTATLVTRLNQQLYASTSPEKYATFYCAVYDDQNGSLSYTNAGHLPPILVRDGNASRLEGHGMVVGIVPDTPYFQTVIQLEPGDLLAAFTDGLTESENSQGEEFGEKRLASLLIENAGEPLDQIVEIVTKRVREWAYDLDNRDDTTMLLARRV